MMTALEDDEDVFHDAKECWDESGTVQPGSDAQGASAVASKEWPLHRAALAGDAVRLRGALVGVTPEELQALDPQGNSALHVAVMAGQRQCVELLLQAGAPAGLRNSRSWAPVYLALERRDRELALQLLRADLAQTKAEVKAKKRAVMQQLWQLPDFSTQLRWELSSSVPGVGLLLSRYAPHDTYTIWKRGSQIRVDGSLMGVREAGQSLLPEWKRGHFSLLYNGAGGGEDGRPLAVFVNRAKNKFVDLQAARKRMGSLQEDSLGKEVDELLAEPCIVKKKVQAQGFKFTPVSGWLFKEVSEKVEGWDTKLYEASGNMVSTTRTKAAFRLPQGCSWEQYMALQFPEDKCEQEVISPFSGKAFSSGSGAPGKRRQARPQQDGKDKHFEERAAVEGEGQVPQPPQASGRVQPDGGDNRRPGEPAAAPQGAAPQDQAAGSGSREASSKGAAAQASRKLTGRFWMASGFPLNMQQLLPLLEVVGTTNKHLAKVAKFMAKYGNLNMFPVKVQVPIMFTVYALVQFKNFKIMAPDGSAAAAGKPGASQGFFKRGASAGSSTPLPADFFEVPEGCQRYEPKAFAKPKAEEQLQRQGTGENDLEL